jgi:hypothetical protein
MCTTYWNWICIENEPSFYFDFFIKTFVTIAEDIMESFSEKVGEITKLKQNDTIF